MSPTTQAHTPSGAVGTADDGRDGPARRRAAGWAGLLLLAAVAAGLVGQGATQRSGSGLAEGFGSETVGCTGSGEQVVIRIRR